MRTALIRKRIALPTDPVRLDTPRSGADELQAVTERVVRVEAAHHGDRDAFVPLDLNLRRVA
jgi:hypothetical protein